MRTDKDDGGKRDQAKRGPDAGRRHPMEPWCESCCPGERDQLGEGEADVGLPGSLHKAGWHGAVESLETDYQTRMAAIGAVRLKHHPAVVQQRGANCPGANLPDGAML